MRGASSGRKLSRWRFVLERADLDLVAARQQAELETYRADVFEARLQPFKRAAHEGQRAADRLEIHVVFEKRAYHAAETARILAERCVFELQDVDLVQQDLPLDQPLQFRRLKFVGGVRRDGGQVRITVIAMHHELDALAELPQLFVGLALAFVIEHHDRMDIAAARQFPQRVIHEDATAVGGRANGIGRNEEHAGTGRLRG